MRTLPYFLIASLTSGAALAATPPRPAPASPNAQMQTVLDEYIKKNPKYMENLTATEARKQPTMADAVQTLVKRDKIEVPSNLAEVKEIQVVGAEGMIPARVYIPKGKQPMPVVVYYHGGGFVLADNNVYDASPRSMAEKTGAIFVSVEYRKAPEFKFPAAHDDAYAAYKWVLDHAAEFGGNPKRVAVAGESAGGNLAINVAMRARDEHIQKPLYEVIIYPVAGTNMETKSYQQYAGAQPLNRPMMEWFVKEYLQNPDVEGKDPRINLLSANLKGLPPTTLITAQIDPLQSEGAELAQKLKAAGVPVQYQNYVGVTHEFFGLASVVNEAKKAQNFAAGNLKRALF